MESQIRTREVVLEEKRKLASQILDLTIQRDSMRQQRQITQKKSEQLQHDEQRIAAQLQIANRALLDLEAKLRLFDREPSVSDHAVLRYLERRMGIDVERIRQEIMTPELKKLIEVFGEGVHLGFVVKDRNVVTVLPKNGETG